MNVRDNNSPTDLSKTLRKLGTLAQLAFVPDDFDQCLRFWTETMGVGPFYLMEHINPDRTTYLGRDTSIDFTAAISYWGDVQIEVIKQHCDTPSIYSEWKKKGMDGLHHVLVVVDDMEEALRLCQEAGCVELQRAWFRGGDAEVAYLDTGGGPGTMVELWKGDDAGKAFFASIKEASANWDGTDPIR